MAGTGSATLNFGAAPGTNTATVDVTGQAAIVAGSYVEAWIQGNDSTAEHNAYKHAIVPMIVRITTVAAGTGFTIQGASEWRLNGTFTVRWVWS